MVMTSADIRLVVAEATPLLVDSRVQRVDQPTERSLCLTLAKPGGKACLFCSVYPGFSRIHLAPGRVRGDSPRRFGQYLRKHLRGARIVAVRQTPGDRVVELAFEGPGDVKRLVFEVFGRNANVIALREDRKIADALRVVEGERRKIAPGEPYAAPPVLKSGPGRPDPDALAADSPSRYFREFYESREQEAAFEKRRGELASRVAREKKPARKRIAGAETSIRSASRAEELRRNGELLKANLGRVTESAKEAPVRDFSEQGAPEVVIRLDPKLSPQANVQSFFRRAKKLERGAVEARGRKTEAEERLRRVEALEARIEGARSIEDLDSLESETQALLGVRQRDKGERPAGPRQFKSADAWDILVGRNADENDRLAFRLAKGNDLWLHAKGVSGSHVVVPTPRGKSVPAETLVDAATLAAYFSGARGSQRVEVDYTQVKYVRRLRKAPPGTVVLTQSKTLNLRVEKVRLERLLRG